MSQDDDRLDVELLAWWWSQPFMGRFKKNPDGSRSEEYLPGYHPIPPPTSVHVRTQACIAAIHRDAGSFVRRHDLISREEWGRFWGAVQRGPPWQLPQHAPLPPMPPLDPEAFLAWLAEQEDGTAMTVSEFAWAMHMSEDDARRFVVGMAAISRKMARLERMGYADQVAYLRADVKTDREAF